MMDENINSEVYVKVLNEPMKILLYVSPSKEMGALQVHNRTLDVSF